MKEIAYGAFPLQPSREAQRNRERPGVLHNYGSSIFSIRFMYPKELRRRDAALWAWETFGGLGGRTRRGFGAILREGGRRLDDVESELSNYRRIRIAGVPSLHRARFVAAIRLWPSAVKPGRRVLVVFDSSGPRLWQESSAAGFEKAGGTQSMAGAGRDPAAHWLSRALAQKPVVTVSRFPERASACRSSFISRLPSGKCGIRTSSPFSSSRGAPTGSPRP